MFDVLDDIVSDIFGSGEESLDIQHDVDIADINDMDSIGDFHSSADDSLMFGQDEDFQDHDQLAEYNHDGPIFGQEEIQQEHGLGDYSTMPNIQGGMNLYDGGLLVAQTSPNMFGGDNIHFCASAVNHSDDLFSEKDGLVDGHFVFGNPEAAFADPNDDLNFHTESEFHILDMDGDGEPDLIVEHFDADGDGYYDSAMTYHIDEDGLHYETLDGEGFTYAMNLQDIDTFDPYYSYDPSVVGHPADAMSHWEDQGETQRCGLYSQKFIIEELTGKELDIDKMADIASEHGWFSETNGTNPGDLNKMLDYYGIPNEMSWNNGLEDLHNVLANGGRAIVAIDADEIWHGEEDGIFSPLDSANHAVEVAGIDYSDPDNPMVILNDSGNPDSGCGEMVPADKFMDAWADSQCQMVAV